MYGTHVRVTHNSSIANGDELAIQGLEKFKKWEENPSDDLPGTTGESYPGSYSYDSTRVIYLELYI
jgi:hypothetical protein